MLGSALHARNFGGRITVLMLVFPVLFQPSFVSADEKDAVAEKKETVEAGTETEIERSKVYMKLGEVTVTEKSSYLTTADVPASVDVVGKDQIENQNVDFSMELLKEVPGVYYGDWNQGVISGTVSMRGFDNNHDAPLTLIVDGIPHNFGYGRMDIQPYFPLEIEQMEVVKGTSDPRYGLSNVAGSVNVHTKQAVTETETTLLTGSFDTYDGSIITGSQNENFSQTYFVGYRETDGYRDHSDLKKGAVSGKWFYNTSDLSAGIIARVFGMDANAPGYLTKEQAESDPQQAASFALTDGGEQQDTHVSLHADYQFSHNLSWSVKSYTQEIERTRWCRWSEAGSQQERFTDDDQYGAISTLSYDLEDIGVKRLQLDWGLDTMYQENQDTRWTSDNRERQGGPIRDWDYNQNSWGSYVQADSDINDWLRFVTALRVDSFDGDFTNRLKNTDSDMLDMDYIWQPKAGTIITPVEGYSLYANWGRTFQLPSTPELFGQSSSGKYISRDLSQSVNDGWETGIKLSPLTWLSTRVDYWEMTASDEIRTKADSSGDYINTGETERKGWDFSLTVRPHEWIALWGSYSIIEAVYTDPGPSLANIKGNDIENIPDYVAKIGVDFKHPSGVFSGVNLESQGSYYVDPQNEKDKEGGYSIWNGTIGYTTGSTTFGFEIKNLLNEEYNAFVWNDTYGFSPGDERSFFVWVKFTI